MSLEATLAANFAAVEARIAAACARSGRARDDVTLIAVSKSTNSAAVAIAADLGQHDFGENRVDMLLEKKRAAPSERFHLIGTLQTNKVNKVVGAVPLIHSVDSRHLLEKIQSRAAQLGIIQPVLLEVNVSGEDSKHGLTPAETHDLITSVASGECAISALTINGLMTMAPQSSPEDIRWVFRDLRVLRDELRATSAAAEYAQRVPLDDLSMGMSNDFEVAIEEGATLIRVGTALFKEN